MTENTHTQTAFDLSREEMAAMSKQELIEAMEEMQEMGAISYKTLYIATGLLSMIKDAYDDKGGLAAKLAEKVFNSSTCPKTREEWETRLLDEVFENEGKLRVLKAFENLVEELSKVTREEDEKK